MNQIQVTNAGEGAVPTHSTLQLSFAERADGVRPEGAALVGVFGEGVPLPLVAALGGLGVDIKAPPLSDASDGPHSEVVAAVAEPFLDAFTARFLHRFAAGAFDHFATLIFARDDVAGLAAYQYALELRRQGRLPDRGPRLHLWNLIHTDSAPADAFNQSELLRLVAHLEGTLDRALEPDTLSNALRAEAQRTAALATLPAGGPEAFVARNAGRWMAPRAHCAALATLPDMQSPGTGPRIALVGSACDIPVLHQICAGFGQIHADLQDYGRRAPQPDNAAQLLRQIVEDPLCARAAPPGRFTRALSQGIEGADLVVASVNANDDSFGWELPRLRQTVDAAGARLVNLGFRPFRPDAAWQDAARAKIAEALT